MDVYEKALKAIRAVFEDRSGTVEDNIVNLDALIDEISILIEALEADL